jgi:hypothetical protein
MLCLFVRVSQSVSPSRTHHTDRQTDRCSPLPRSQPSPRPFQGFPQTVMQPPPNEYINSTVQHDTHGGSHLTHTCAVQQQLQPRSLVPARLLHAHTLPLVDTLHRGHGLALGLVEGGANDAAVRQVDLAVGLLLPAERVLHPVLVVALGEVLAGVGAARLLPVGGGDGRLGAVLQSC